MTAEGINVPIHALLAEATFAKNVLVSVHGNTPYIALYGRVPRLFLPECEGQGMQALDDSKYGPLGSMRHAHRLREVTVQSIVESTATERLKAASNSKTRVAGENPKLDWVISLTFQGHLIPKMSRDGSAQPLFVI